ncbi:hypothetical protein V8D89_016320 [Ganoderma adspersum]
MHTLRQEILPPSSVEFAACLNFTSFMLSNASLLSQPSWAHSNVVVTRSSLLCIFKKEREKERLIAVHKGTEVVEGEVEIDLLGEGFVHMGAVKVSSLIHLSYYWPMGMNGAARPPTVNRFYLLCELRLHGVVKDLETVQTIHSLDDKLDSLLVSFKDAKIALLEWSASIHDVVTISIHTYNRALQLMAIDSSLLCTELHIDPLSRCVALSLPKDSLAILLFYKSQAELDIMEQELGKNHSWCWVNGLRGVEGSPGKNHSGHEFQWRYVASDVTLVGGEESTRMVTWSEALQRGASWTEMVEDGWGMGGGWVGDSGE